MDQQERDRISKLLSKTKAKKHKISKEDKDALDAALFFSKTVLSVCIQVSARDVKMASIESREAESFENLMTFQNLLLECFKKTQKKKLVDNALWCPLSKKTFPYSVSKQQLKFSLDAAKLIFLDLRSQHRAFVKCVESEGVLWFSLDKTNIANFQKDFN